MDKLNRCKNYSVRLLEADILISSTGATDFVIDLELMQFVERLRKGKPLFMVDIAVPRDLDPRIGELTKCISYMILMTYKALLKQI